MKKSLLKSVKKHELEGLQKEETLLSNLSALDDVLKDVYDTHCPTYKEYEKRRDLICVFSEIARELYGNEDNCPIVEEFGSFLMNMFNSSSDLDLSINFSNKTAMGSRHLKIQILKKFVKNLYKMRDQGRVTNVKPILTARVPVVKVTDCGSGVECDFSVGNLDGIAKSQIVLLISSIDERFQKLCLLMKAWAKAQQINSAVDGTLNSLSLILFAAFHLQTREIPILPPFSSILKDGTDIDTVKKSVATFTNYGENNKESLAELFVSLLVKLKSVDALWSEGLCASTYKGSWIHKTWNLKNKNGPGLGCISIEDFTDRSQNTCRALKKILMHLRIYSRIHFSLNKIRFFTEGKINAVKLKRLLFGEDLTAIGRASMLVNHRTESTLGKRKRPCEKKKTQPCVEVLEKIQKTKTAGGKGKKAQTTGNKGKKTQTAGDKGMKTQIAGNATSISGKKPKSQETYCGPQSLLLPTPTIQGSQSDALGIAALTLLSGQLISTPNSSIRGYIGHPHHVSHPPFHHSRGFRPEFSRAGFLAVQQQPGPYLPTQDPRVYGQERTYVETLSYAQGYGGFRHQRSHAEGFNHDGPSFPVSQPYSFSNQPIQSNGGYRMEDNNRHANHGASRSSYTTMPPHHPQHASLPYADHRRERPYAPWPQFPLVPSQYLNNTYEYGNRYGFR